MKEFIEKLIGRLEERKTHLMKDFVLANVVFSSKQKALDRINEIDGAISIVNQLAKEYKDNVTINGQYCWQTCGATEHCKECNRLCNGNIDYYENYDFMVEENADFCEWEVVTSNINSEERWVYYNKISCNPDLKGCLPTFHFSKREQENFLKHCPYCGKKIKVVEPKGE